MVTQTSGSSHTDYGFTGESYGDSTQLLYLRARYYNPADGRFVSRDTWDGNYSSPQSLNRWNYVEGNPVNLIDPTGHNPFTFGYMEGYSFGGGLGEGYFGGEEIVYDYATMTRARFTYEGTLGSPLQASAGLTVYTGEITGFGYKIGEVRSKQIIDDYSARLYPKDGGREVRVERKKQ